MKNCSRFVVMGIGVAIALEPFSVSATQRPKSVPSSHQSSTLQLGQVPSPAALSVPTVTGLTSGRLPVPPSLADLTEPNPVCLPLDKRLGGRNPRLGQASPIAVHPEFTPNGRTGRDTVLEDIREADYPSAESGPHAPDYLNPDPNPLLFQTQSEEVAILGTQPITLEQAVDLAYRNNQDLQVVQLQLERSRSVLRETQASLYPSVDARGSLTRSETLNTGGAFLGGTESLDALGTLELTYNVFTSGQRSGTINAAERTVRLNELAVEVQQEQLRLDTANDYYDLQDAEEQIRINRAALEESCRNLEDANARERAGIGTRFDVLRAEVEVANDEQALTQAKSEKRIAQRQLAEILNLPPSFDIAAIAVVAERRWILSLEESIVLAFQNRAELERQLVQREIDRQQRRAALGALGPQVSLFARYNVRDDLIDDNGLSDDYSVGAQVSIRLFEGGAARASAAQEEADIAIAETQFADTRNSVRFQVEQAYFTLQANWTNIATAQLAQEQAEEALRLANLRFEAGVGTQLDVISAQAALTQADGNLVTAKLGYNRALVALERAISNVTDEP